MKGCNTLLALQELAELFSLPFDRLSIFDAYPFITKKELDPEDVEHSESHTAFHKMLLEKRPTVILSGWNLRSFGDFTTNTLHKRAIGAVFPPHTIPYCGLIFSVVNMTYPSYYMNYNPTESCFRHLQILEFAQACGRLWGTWQEKTWMADLRERCRARAIFLYDSKFDLSSMFICDSSDQAFVTERLIQILTRLEPVLAGSCYRFASKAQIEERLSRINLSEPCSDASLILHHIAAIRYDKDKCAVASMTFICSWYNRRWPALSESFVPVPIGSRGIYGHHCFDRIPVVDLPPLARQIESCLMSFAKKVNLSWMSHGNGDFEADFEAQSSAFFQLAKGLKMQWTRFQTITVFGGNFRMILYLLWRL